MTPLLSLPLKAWRKLVWILQGKQNPMLRHCRRIIHIGANHGQERDTYARYGLEVLWIEALPEVHTQLAQHIAAYPRQSSVCALLTDVDGEDIKFNVTSNNAESSSIYPFKEDGSPWPDVVPVHSVHLRSTRLDSLLHQMGTEPNHYDGAVLDVQGAELRVLKGCGPYLNHWRWVQCEATDFQAYENSCQLSEIESFMDAQGFTLVKKICFSTLPGIGNSFELFFARR